MAKGKGFDGRGIDKAILKQRQAQNNKLRAIARNVMNDLAREGPVWSGDFRDSYIATALGSTVAGSGQYPYSIHDIPELKITKREMGRVHRLRVGNTAGHARVAMDLDAPRKPDRFEFPGYGPEGEILFRGIRPEKGKRGQIEGGGNENRSTAPLDWYTTYMKGGKLQRSIKQGVSVQDPKGSSKRIR